MRIFLSVQRNWSGEVVIGLKKKAKDLLDIVETNPYQNPPPYENLLGDLAGFYSRRINIQHRLVYQVIE